ncbi:hypothetical protein D3C84_1197010 [compost metagenome]
MVADHYRWRVEVGGADEVRDGVVVQMRGAADVQRCVGRGVADVDQHGALFAQGLGLFGGDTFEFAHGGLLWPD